MHVFVQGALQKKQLIASFALFFGFIIQNQVKSGILNRMSTR